MSLNALSALASALMCGVLAGWVLSLNTRSFSRRAFATAMAALALEELCVALSAESYVAADLLRWQRAKIIALAFVPASWLLFSISYSRPDYAESVTRWKWTIIAAFTMPAMLAIALSNGIFAEVPQLHGDSTWSVKIGWPGQLYYISIVAGLTLVLANLERTLRASSGVKQWQIKFLIIGLGGYLAFRIYSTTQTLLFSSLDSTLELTNSASLLVGCLFMILSLRRAKNFEVDVYLSNTFVYNSVTVLVVGLYILLVGVLSWLLIYFTGDQFLSILPFAVFLGFVALSAVFFSSVARRRAIAVINRHLGRPAYDYRQIWREFSERTASITDTKRLCATVADLVTKTFDAPAVSIWLTSHNASQVMLGGSTSFSAADDASVKTLEPGTGALIRGVRGLELPADFGDSHSALRDEIERANPDYFRRTQIRYVMPLSANQQILGILTMSDCQARQSLSQQDSELLKTIADQTANALLNRKLSEELLQAKELEAFQTMSAFFAHDLKNLAGGLSLVARNLPRHLDNPEFRGDALKMLSTTVDKITELCERMAQWGPTQDDQRVEVNLNDVVSATVENFKGTLKSSVVTKLDAVPKLRIDPEQLQKVLINLILNAEESRGTAGEIRISTAEEDGAVCIAVSDNGSGLSREFMQHRLFRPFQTSKKHGFGIGLFQCKSIIEAHQGRIEVESEEGKGSTFRVLLPLTATVDQRRPTAEQ